MVGSVNSIAMSAFARVSMGIEEHSSDFGIASLNIANGFANQDNPFGFSRLSPNNEEGPAFTDMSSMGGLSSVSAVTSHMVNAIQNVNTDSAVTDRSFIDEIEAITNARSVFELPDPSDDVSAAATTAALVALAGTTGAVGSASAVASVSSIGDQSTIGSSSTISSDVDPMNTSSSDASSPPSYTEEPITSSGGSGSGEALSGLGGSSALSGDAQQAVMIEEFAEISSQRIDTGESRAEAGVGLAQTTKAFREMEASTKLQDDIEITHAKALSLVLMGS
ncbi:MAG: hypothetical protein CFH43_00667 [Proteobacteria bacterium]|nr:MAG: hypothetical protein CFH43_00667 [Pseudomonadota bacterium]